MSTIAFHPWVGNLYSARNRFNARVLILGEFHHGARQEMHVGTTVQAVEVLAKERRHPYFTTLAKFLLGMERESWISDSDRAEIWDHVAFYNYVQETVGDYRDRRPTPAMWGAAAAPLLELLAQLKPQLLVVVGRELHNHLPPLPRGIEVCRNR